MWTRTEQYITGDDESLRRAIDRAQSDVAKRQGLDPSDLSAYVTGGGEVAGRT